MSEDNIIIITPIQNHDGYFASNDGKIYSQWVNKGMHGLVKEGALKELKCSRANKHGHKMVRMGGRKGKTKLVHRIIYEAFNGEIKNDLMIRHINDLPDDNRLANLVPGTQSDNMQDAIRSGRFAMGVKNGQSKLGVEDVLFIRRMAGVLTHKEMGEMFGVTRSTIGHVVRRSSWKHIDEKEIS